MNNNWKIQIIEKPGYFVKEIYIYRRGNAGKIEMLENNGKIKEYKEGSDYTNKPFISLEPEQMQALSDELSRCGYKPEKGYQVGKLEATEKHLEDLRKLLKLSKLK